MRDYPTLHLIKAKEPYFYCCSTFHSQQWEEALACLYLYCCWKSNY